MNKDELKTWSETLKCERCGGKPDTIYTKGSPLDEENNPNLLCVICKPCEKIYEQSILAMTAPFRENCPPDCEHCREMRKQYGDA